MNIGYFNAQGPENGIEHWFDLEIDELRKRGHHVKPFWLRGDQPTKGDVDEMDFAHFHYSHVALQYRRMGVPFCISPHTNDIFPDNGKKLIKASKHPNCKFVTYQSQYHLEHYKKWGIDKPLVHLPMCCRTNLFNPKSKELGDRMICGGRLVPRKGLDKIMYLGNLLVFGKGELKHELQSINPTNEFCGSVNGEELKKLFERSYVYLYPSTIASDGNRDGIPNTIKEALLMKLWVIASPVAGIPEVDTVILNEDWSKENIQKITQNLIYPNEKGRQYILDNFSPEVCIDKLERAINEHI